MLFSFADQSKHVFECGHVIGQKTKKSSKIVKLGLPGGTIINKVIVICAIILITAAICLIGIQTIKSHVTDRLVTSPHYFNNETLNPYRSFFFASEMEEGAFFDINISASSDVTVKVGNTGLDLFREPITINIIFQDYGKSIIQRVNVTRKDTYQVEIANEGADSITLSGAIYAKKTVKIVETIHPYSSRGTFILLVGVGILIYGVLAKPKKRHLRNRPRLIQNSARALWW